jgi:hypothetical protein
MQSDIIWSHGKYLSGIQATRTKVVHFYYIMQSHSHMPLKVALLVTMHHMTVRSCDSESIQYEATTKP